MICPSLPQDNNSSFSEEAMEALRIEQLEHVWAEVINVRGDAMKRTINALIAGGFEKEASDVARISMNRAEWEEYSRKTYQGHIAHCPPEKLRYLQYVKKSTLAWWTGKPGAVLLGAAAAKNHASTSGPAAST
jgi:hypothetical protein